jgi:hypothetical protein
MKNEIKNIINQAIETILDKENYYIDIINIDDVLNKVVYTFENVYKIVPYKHIFNPDMALYVCALPFEERSFGFVFNVSEKSIKASDLYKLEFPEKNRLVVHIKFSPHFGKEYNPVAVKFIPEDVEDLRIYIDATYFTIPLEVDVTKYDLV